MSEFAEIMINNMKDRSVESVTKVIEDSFNTGFVMGTVYTTIGIIGVTSVAVGGKVLYNRYKHKKMYRKLSEISEGFKEKED